MILTMVLTTNEDSLEPHVYPVVRTTTVSAVTRSRTQTWQITAYLHHKTQWTRHFLEEAVFFVFAVVQMKMHWLKWVQHNEISDCQRELHRWILNYPNTDITFHRALVSSNYQLRNPVLIRPTPSAETKTPLIRNSTGSQEKLCCDLFNMEEKSYPEKMSFFQSSALFFPRGFERKLTEIKESPPRCSGTRL